MRKKYLNYLKEAIDIRLKEPSEYLENIIRLMENIIFLIKNQIN